VAKKGHRELFEAALAARRSATGEASAQIRVKQRRDETAAIQKNKTAKRRETPPMPPKRRPAVVSTETVEHKHSPDHLPVEQEIVKPAVTTVPLKQQSVVEPSSKAWSDKERIRDRFVKLFKQVRCNDDVIVVEQPIGALEHLTRDQLTVEIRSILADNGLEGVFIRPAGSPARKKFRITLT